MDLADVDPPLTLLLEWSDDGGRTWTGSRTLALAPGQKRAFTTRLGSFRQRVFRVSWLGQSTIYAIDADIVGGVA